MSEDTLLVLFCIFVLALAICGTVWEARNRRRREEHHQRRVRRMIRLSEEEMAAFRELVRKEEECYSVGVFQGTPEFMHYYLLALYGLAEQDSSPGLRDDCTFFHLTDYGRKFRDERGL